MRITILSLPIAFLFLLFDLENLLLEPIFNSFELSICHHSGVNSLIIRIWFFICRLLHLQNLILNIGHFSELSDYISVSYLEPIALFFELLIFVD